MPYGVAYLGRCEIGRMWRDRPVPLMQGLIPRATRGLIKRYRNLILQIPSCFPTYILGTIAIRGKKTAKK